MYHVNPVSIRKQGGIGHSDHWRAVFIVFRRRGKPQERGLETLSQDDLLIKQFRSWRQGGAGGVEEILILVDRWPRDSERESSSDC